MHRRPKEREQREPCAWCEGCLWQRVAEGYVLSASGEACRGWPSCKGLSEPCVQSKEGRWETAEGLWMRGNLCVAAGPYGQLCLALCVGVSSRAGTGKS